MPESLEDASLHTYVPYYLLPYGKALTIVEPDVLIGRMVEVTPSFPLVNQTPWT
ncbi:hypothetical protein POTG_04058 [Paenibacillus sp. oral taxon 786 str. D14]|nr:hypothetical protein POTG_04058 [Paenibacillus sp. oral taxon 786 str. D14]